jgi:hypothetical protein
MGPTLVMGALMIFAWFVFHGPNDPPPGDSLA